MENPAISHHIPSNLLATLWVPAAFVGTYALTVCSVAPWWSLGAAIVWFGLQICGNAAAADVLDDRYWDESSSIKVIGRSLAVAVALAIGALPLLQLFPESTNCI